jgi:hypothetical protein
MYCGMGFLDDFGRWDGKAGLRCEVALLEGLDMRDC